VNLIEENSKIKLLIKDEGKGIPNEEKDKIFNKFYRLGNLHTRNAKGTGLGLYLTKRIIDHHNGKIIVSDNSPHGSIFEITLDK
jgi:signal transduction histidine kinase